MRDENEETTRVGNTKDNSKVETLTRCLEMHVFKGWNPKGWVFRAERFFAAHGMSQGEKLAAATISLDGEALAWF